MPEKDFFDCGPASFYNCRVRKTTDIVGGLATGILLLARWKLNSRLPLTPDLCRWERENGFQGIGISRRGRLTDGQPEVLPAPEPSELPVEPSAAVQHLLMVRRRGNLGELHNDVNLVVGLVLCEIL